MPPTVIDDFLPADQYKQLLAYVQSQPMHYGSKSNGRTDPHGHWSWKPIHDNQKNLADLTLMLPPQLLQVWGNMKVLQDSSSSVPAVIRCYANGYTYGTDGYFHTDSDRADEQTIILFMCDKWEPDWGGGTIWGVSGYTLPAPNRAVIIPSNMIHAAHAVSRKCNVLRTTLMFKTRPKRSLGFESLSKFLVDSGALRLGHKSGTLHDHLVRVYQLLLEHPRAGQKMGIVFGGGLHSIYGTNAYDKQLVILTPNSRGRVVSQFGKEAEALAYLFSVIERPETLEKAAGFKPFDGALWLLQMRHAQEMTVTNDQFRSLCLIECANLLDQGSLDKWPNLKSIWDAK